MPNRRALITVVVDIPEDREPHKVLKVLHDHLQSTMDGFMMGYFDLPLASYVMTRAESGIFDHTLPRAYLSESIVVATSSESRP